jgi:hypothetical protein
MGAAASQIGNFQDKSVEDAKALIADKNNLMVLWDRIDFNGNGKVSLAEIDK